MRSSRYCLATLLVVVCGPVSMLADTVGVTPRKLVLIDKTNGGAFQKGTYVVKDEVAGIHKGPGTDVANVSARLDIGYDTAFEPRSASFPMPSGANNGLKGWLSNTESVASYKNVVANRHIIGNEVSLGVLRLGKLIKVRLEGLGGGMGSGNCSFPPPAPSRSVSQSTTAARCTSSARAGRSAPARLPI